MSGWGGWPLQPSQNFTAGVVSLTLVDWKCGYMASTSTLAEFAAFSAGSGRGGSAGELKTAEEVRAIYADIGQTSCRPALATA